MSKHFEKLVEFWTEVASTTQSEDIRQIAQESIELWAGQLVRLEVEIGEDSEDYQYTEA